MDMVRGMILAVNGHLFKGLGKIISGFFINARKNKKYEKIITREAHHNSSEKNGGSI